mmetsp:Transcript_20753/g.44583  ORF Transcript_20753/g.44583 Transcript_20753/m.44583 type:complete len:222 (-) Transcript_20753:19-684(-)
MARVREEHVEAGFSKAEESSVPLGERPLDVAVQPCSHPHQVVGCAIDSGQPFSTEVHHALGVEAVDERMLCHLRTLRTAPPVLHHLSVVVVSGCKDDEAFACDSPRPGDQRRVVADAKGRVANLALVGGRLIWLRPVVIALQVALARSARTPLAHGPVHGLERLDPVSHGIAGASGLAVEHPPTPTPLRVGAEGQQREEEGEGAHAGASRTRHTHERQLVA